MHHELTPMHHMYWHLFRNGLIAIVLIITMMAIGMLGYHNFESMSWSDAFLNAAMILSGMGPATGIITTSGKIFAGCYALFSGLIFIALIVIMLTPVIHYIFRKIHLEQERN